jgi:ABC-2 type transport system ATP-binding protein
MLASPDVLILDEPTIGLDPNQVRETRRLIRSLSDRHTVLISTHILAEAEAICKRVLIIDSGRIIADGAPAALAEENEAGILVTELQGDADAISAALSAIEGVTGVQVEPAGEWSRFALATEPDADVRQAVFALAVNEGWPLRELTRTRESLEDVFHRLTVGDGAAVGSEGGR